MVLEFSFSADILRRMNNLSRHRTLYIYLGLAQLISFAGPAFASEQDSLQVAEKALKREEYVLQDDIVRLSKEIEQRQKRLDETYKRLKRIQESLNEVSKELSVSNSSWNN